MRNLWQDNKNARRHCPHVWKKGHKRGWASRERLFLPHFFPAEPPGNWCPALTSVLRTISNARLQISDLFASFVYCLVKSHCCLYFLETRGEHLNSSADILVCSGEIEFELVFHVFCFVFNRVWLEGEIGGFGKNLWCIFHRALHWKIVTLRKALNLLLKNIPESMYKLRQTLVRKIIMMA